MQHIYFFSFRFFPYWNYRSCAPDLQLPKRISHILPIITATSGPVTPQVDLAAPACSHLFLLSPPSSSLQPPPVPPALGSRVVTSSSSATVEHTGSSTFSVSREGDDAGEMREGRSFLEDRSKVTGFSDVLSRMGATEAGE